MLSDARIPSSRVPILTDDNTRTTTREWFRFFETLSAVLAFGHARFYDTTSPVFVANTPRLLPLGSTEFTRGLSLVASRVTVATPGQYLLDVRLQLTNANANDDDFAVWLRINGADQARSATWVTVPAVHAAVNGAAALQTTLYADFAVGDYFELYGLSKLGYAAVATVAASGVPAYPASPGVILTATQIL